LTFKDFQISKHFHMKFCHSSLIDLQNTKTQKLAKTSENNKAKGLTSVNLGVQIHNIWHSSSSTSTQVPRCFFVYPFLIVSSFALLNSVVTPSINRIGLLNNLKRARPMAKGFDQQCEIYFTVILLSVQPFVWCWLWLFISIVVFATWMSHMHLYMDT